MRFLYLLGLIVFLDIRAAQCVGPLSAQAHEDSTAVDCVVASDKDAVVLGDPVRITLKTSGGIRAAYLDGVFLGGGGGAIQIRPFQSRWVVGMVRSSSGVVFCSAPVVVVNGASVKLGTKLVRIKTTKNEEMKIRFLPENRECDLGTGGCIASAVAGAIAVVSTKPELQGFSCNGRFHKATRFAEYQITDFSVEDDLDCEAIF